MVTEPLIELQAIRKSYGGGEDEPCVEVLHGIDLTIHAGEFVAVIGPSGSGKSTLMHILGCLDHPTSGTYRFAGRDIAGCGPDELARLRREAFGFVFQGYHLIRTLDALHNVQVPAVYAGTATEERTARAEALLHRLGLQERSRYRPNQLSGGQQQRVSIARALMNGGQVILADEPTGALDSKSGVEVMALLQELAVAGHTVILITHDPQVAAQAGRVVRISDGVVIADQRNAATVPVTEAPCPVADGCTIGPVYDTPDGATWLADAQEAMASAWRTLWASRFRTLLTLLGIVIGVASVIVLMAVGQGAGEQMLAKMALYGTHRMYVRPVTDTAKGLRSVFTEADARLVGEVPNVRVAMPFLYGRVMLQASDRNLSTPVWCVTADAPEVLHWQTVRGTFFTREDEQHLATVLVLGKKVKDSLFGKEEHSVGRYLLVNNVPFRVIGEMQEKGVVSGDSDDDELVLMPFSTGSRRVLGTTQLSFVSVLVESLEKIDQTVLDITAHLKKTRRVEDFRVSNSAGEIKAKSDAARQQNLLMALIAGISLVVGGIGVMNIMLMAVKERTREIGIRMAVGARQRDIQRQFLTEAVLVSLVGGVAGVVIGLVIGAVLIAAKVPVIFTVRSMLLAFGCAVATGLVFGFMPARQAARLDPVTALAGE